ncbi:MAG: hypothetical protein AAFR21_07040 [Pseudomonadota bacterium]
MHFGIAIIAGFLGIAPVEASTFANDCPEPTRLMVHRLSGDWSTSVSTDEGWQGEGTSTFEVDPSRGCALVERGVFALDTGDGNIIKSKSLAVYAWDDLSSVWKLMSTDSRGYTHVGLGVEAGDRNWAFEIQKAAGQIADRRVLFRPREDAPGFQWVWQGRDGGDAEWHDRFVSVYSRVEKD